MVSRAAGDDVNLIEGIEVIRIPLELVHDDGLAVFRDALALWDVWSLPEELLKTIIDRAAVYDIAAETSDMSYESSG